MQSKLTQRQIDVRLKIYQTTIDRLWRTFHFYGAGDYADQAAALIKETRSNRDAFIKRMEKGAVGRKPV